MKRISMIALSLLFAASTAQAGWEEADLCAAELSENSKVIYDRLKPQIVVGDLEGNEAKIKATVQQMIADGELSFLTARGKARKAVDCLQMAND